MTPDSELTYGGLFEGYGGLTMAAQRVLPGRLAWYSEIEPAACRVMAHYHPEVPNLGDVSAVGWSAAPRVNVLTAGFPCQDISLAGLRTGLMLGTRSGLWTHTAKAIDALRPDLVVIENVRGLLSTRADGYLEPCTWCVGDERAVVLRALGCVLGDLADIGFDAEWCGLSASDVGAPHGRFRVVVLAWPAGHPPHFLLERCGQIHGVEPWGQGPTGGPGGCAACDPDCIDLHGRPAAGFQGKAGSTAGSAPDSRCLLCGPWRSAESGEAPIGRPLGDPAGCGALAVADPDEQGLQGHGGFHAAPREGEASAHGGKPVSDAQGVGWGEGWPEPARVVGGSDVALGGDGSPANPHGHAVREQPESIEWSDGRTVAPLAVQWGRFDSAIRRWERVLGRSAPEPTVIGKRGGRQLSPHFVEWMMGLPDGHVTVVPDVSRNEALKMLGNGVVPQQVSAGIRHLLGRL